MVFTSIFDGFATLVDTPIVLWTLVGVAVLFVLFFILFLVFARKAGVAKRELKAEKEAKSKVEEFYQESQKTGADLTVKVNTLTDELAQTKSALKEAKLLRGAADSRYEDLKAKHEALLVELEASKKKLAAVEAAKKARAKKKAKKVEKVKIYTKEELEVLTKHELLTLAKTRKLSGFYHINKDELVKFILTEQEKSKK